MIVYMELESIERELGFSAHTLYGISNNLGRHYRKVTIPKADGKTRVLSVPDEMLKAVQRAIVNKLLVYEPVSAYATAYRIGGGTKRNALPHVGRGQVLKLDIKGFFDNILYSSVKDMAFPKEKYSKPIRILLAMLCYCGDALPQGAPSSPIITNIIMRDFDSDVGEWCSRRGIRYTRYCDDMTFSGNIDAGEVISFVSERLGKMGFFLNKRKTVLARSGAQQTVTGIVVNEKLNVPKAYKRAIRQEVFFCERYGVASHLEHTGNTLSPLKYLRSLLGKINYVLSVTPKDGEFSALRETVQKMINNL